MSTETYPYTTPKITPILTTYAEKEQHMRDFNEQEKAQGGVRELYISRSKLGYCKNDDCDNTRRHASAYCGKCR